MIMQPGLLLRLLLVVSTTWSLCLSSPLRRIDFLAGKSSKKGGGDRRGKSYISVVVFGPPITKGRTIRVTDPLTLTKPPAESSEVTLTSETPATKEPPTQQTTTSLSPPRKPADGGRCQRTKHVVQVKRGRCKKNVEVYSCEGQCRTSIEHRPKYGQMQVVYRDTCCRPVLETVKRIEVDMNDDECKRQRSKSRKGKRVNSRRKGRFRNHFLYTVGRCECTTCPAPCPADSA